MSGSGRLSQDITTISGQSYRIDFALSGNPGATGNRFGDKPMSVLWNNSSVGSFTHIHTLGEQHNNLRWADQSVIVVGTGSDKLTFLSTGGTNDAGPMIDDVTITAIVPEPSTGVLSCLGVVSLLIRRRH
ncbi:MAG: PEP-CTERM sorting domain-containing protein [Akkermansiaceae bacterium]